MPALAGEPHVAALVKLVRAVARRDVLPGYAIHAGGRTAPTGLTLIETWRGPRLAALVFEAARPVSPGSLSGAGEDGDANAGLAGTIGALAGIGRVSALWLAAPGTGPSGGRLGVAVPSSSNTGRLMTLSGETPRSGGRVSTGPRRAPPPCGSADEGGQIPVA